MNEYQLVILSLFLSCFGLIAAGVALFFLYKFYKLKSLFFSGSNAQNLESVINHLAEGLHILQENQVLLETHLKNLKSDFGLAVQKVGLVKFNPFEGAGGNLSFTIALLDGQNSGLIITSMHGREQNRVYTKQIVKGKCEIQLTEEELSAIKFADKYHQNLITK